MRPWSYSRLTTWEECPRQYQYRYVEGRQGSRPPSAAADRGTRIHKLAEDYLNGLIHIYPPELQKVSSHAMRLKTGKASPEGKVAVRKDWTLCDYEDPEAYFRAIIDVLMREDHILHVQDWKTGQVYPDHKDQLKLYVAIASIKHPDAKEFHPAAIYIDQGHVDRHPPVTADMVKPIRLLLEGRINNAESDDKFLPTPNSRCKWCDYSRRFGGPCEH